LISHALSRIKARAELPARAGAFPVSEAQRGWGGSLGRALRFFGPGRLILTAGAAGAAGAAAFVAAQNPALAAILAAAAIVLTILTLANPIQTALTMSGLMSPEELKARFDGMEQGFSSRAANLENGFKVHGDWIGRVEEIARTAHESARTAHDHAAGSTAAVNQIAAVLVDANLSQRLEVLEASRVAGDVGKSLRDLELRLTFLEQEPIEQAATASARKKKG
jgi:hypothetical protein